VAGPGTGLEAQRKHKTAMHSYRAQVITVSTRAASGERADTSGEVIAQALGELGFSCAPTIVIPDGPEVAEAITGAVDAGLDLVITTGGTGLTPKESSGNCGFNSCVWCFPRNTHRGVISGSCWPTRTIADY
jgi:hypothetical protein